MPYTHIHVFFLRNKRRKDDNNSDDDDEEVENAIYDATETNATDPSHSNTNPPTVTDNQRVVNYTSVKKVRWAVPVADENENVESSSETDINLDYEIVDEPVYDSTFGRPSTPPVNTYDKVSNVTNAVSNIDVDEYGYNVTTQRTNDRRNIHTDNVYSRLS